MNKMKGIFHIILVLCFCSLTRHELKAQATVDSAVLETPAIKIKKGSIFSGRPGKSMLMSLVIPGSGQIYNKSYLRVPFVWGAVGGMGYVVYYNSREYKCLKNAYIAAVDMVPYTPTNCSPRLKEFLMQINDPARLRTPRDQANADRQLAIIGFSLVWLANGIDAFVDAHLKDFDIDDNLTFEIGSKFENDPFTPMRVGVFVQF